MIPDQPFISRDFLCLGIPGDDSHQDKRMSHLLPAREPSTLPHFKRESRPETPVNGIFVGNVTFEGGKEHDMWTKVSVKQHLLPARNPYEEKFVEQTAENVPDGSTPLTLQRNFGNFAYPVSSLTVDDCASRGKNMFGGASLESRVHFSGPKSNERCAPLTIFYGGTVNVYKNISLEKAHAIMRFAALHANSTCDPVSHLGIGTADMLRDVQPCASAPSLQPEYQQSVVPGALPQARKASLTRFLEKRRERLQSRSPYTLKQDDSLFPEERFSSSNDVFTS